MIYKKKSVAIIEPVGGHGGLEFYDFGLAKAIANKGIKTILYTGEETTIDSRIETNFAVKKIYKGIYGRSNKVLRGFRFIFCIMKNLLDAKKENIDIAHFHLFHFSTIEYFCIRLFSLFGFKIIATIHDVEPFDKYQESLNINYNKFIRYIDQIIVHNNFALKCVKTAIKNTPAEKLNVVQTTDFDILYNVKVSTLEAKKKLSLPANARIILFFGQLKKVKGIDVLLESFKKIAERFGDVILVIAGKTWKMDLKVYEDYVKSNNLNDKIIFHNYYIKNEDVPYYFKASDITVLPYKKIYNSSVVLRAMDYGSAVIASDLEMFREVISDHENGVLFRTEDSNDLADRLEELLESPAILKNLKLNARDFIEKNYSLSEVSNKMIQIYSKMEA